MFLQQDFKPPGLEEARKVQAEIRRLGVQDIELKWDAEFGVWCVVQIERSTGILVTMGSLSQGGEKLNLLWYCQNKEDGGYRPPNQDDVNNVIAVVRESHHWWEKGGDAYADEADRRDMEKRQKKEARHRERVQPHVKALQKAIREELG